MKLRSVGFLTLIALTWTLEAWAADLVPDASRSQAGAMPPIVRSEYARTQQELQNDLFQAKRKLVALEAEKNQVISQARANAQVDLSGVKTLQDYSILMVARYTDDRGEFQSGAELVERDVETLNKLFNSYLQTVPFKGRVSAGQARKTLEWGGKRLSELNEQHAEPNDKNNSDLEIIAKQSKDTENQVVRIMATAEKLNFRLGTDFNAVAQRAAPTAAPAAPVAPRPGAPAPTSQRAPASVPAKR